MHEFFVCLRLDILQALIERGPGSQASFSFSGDITLVIENIAFVVLGTDQILLKMREAILFRSF